MHEKFGKVLIFLDNASWHKSKKTMTLLEKYKGDIILEYIPPYTPELNPIETQWMVESMHNYPIKIFPKH